MAGSNDCLAAKLPSKKNLPRMSVSAASAPPKKVSARNVASEVANAMVNAAAVAVDVVAVEAIEMIATKALLSAMKKLSAIPSAIPNAIATKLEPLVKMAAIAAVVIATSARVNVGSAVSVGITHK